MKIKALNNKVLVSDLERGSRMINGIIIPDDNMKSQGIRPRWAQVYSVGDNITDIQPGQWILIEHGRWTRTLKIRQESGENLLLWAVEWPDSVLVVSDEPPDTTIFSKWA